MAQLARRGGRHSLVGFLCECDDPDCLATVPMTVDAYDGISQAGHRVVVTSHRVPERV